MKYTVEDLISDLTGSYYEMKHETTESALRWTEVWHNQMGHWSDEDRRAVYELILTTHNARSFPPLPKLLKAYDTIQARREYAANQRGSGIIRGEHVGWAAVEFLAGHKHFENSRRMAFNEGWLGSLIRWVVINGQIPKEGNFIVDIRRVARHYPNPVGTSRDAIMQVARQYQQELSK